MYAIHKKNEEGSTWKTIYERNREGIRKNWERTGKELIEETKKEFMKGTGNGKKSLEKTVNENWE